MAKWRSCAGVLVVAIVLGVAAGAPAESVSSHHGPAWRSYTKPTSIVFSADGRRITAKYWRAATNRPGTDWAAFVVKWDLVDKKRTITPDASPSRSKHTWSPPSTATDKELAAAKRLRLLKLIGRGDRVRLSSDGKLVAICARGKTVLRKSDGKLIKTFPAGGGQAAFSPDSKRLAAADYRGIIRIWDIATSKLLRTLRLDDHNENTVLAAAVQIASKFGDPKGNRKRIRQAVASAARLGAKIVVLPETAVTGYMTYDIKTAWRVPGRNISDELQGSDPKDAAETVPGPSTKFFAPLAKQYGIYLTVPLLEIDRKSGKHYNTSVLLGPDGKILIHYRKRNPWIWAEMGWAEEGNLGNPVVDTPFGRLGLLICFDVHDQFKVMSKKKIDTLLYSIAWVDGAGSDWFSVQLPSRAKECAFNVIGANWTLPKDFKPKWHGYGKSLIISSKGKILAKAAKDLSEETVFAEIPIPKAK
ncbi:MAG: nitrilase-related carbon-nitrogen hydrolase [Phycisphaerae bacterium]|jgi:predicted amidohydrolase|nr:nitrilase-related carbon-nitrogen hydrolase [Phycisphaerae bacterium]